MNQNHSGRRRLRRWPFVLLRGVVLVIAAVLVLQMVWAHRAPPFRPDYPRVALGALLEAEPAQRDYDTLFRQTGLARPAIDALLAQGEVGIAQIIAIQDQFWAEYDVACLPLFSGFTLEDRLSTSDGEPAYGPALPALEDGDVLVSFSTHSVGWRHGHAGIVVDAKAGITLEAAVIGTDSQRMSAQHWRAYSNFMVLRLREMTPELRQALVDYCNTALLGVPYRLASGLFGKKAPSSEEASFGVQCSYLVWYAFAQFGFDVDADGGALVTVKDLADSPLFEVVQVYGIDPDTLIAPEGSAGSTSR